MKREGPKTVRTEYKSCYGCKYHRSEMFRTGSSPIYHHSCKHPDVVKNGGIWIERESDHTPTWCPFFKQ